MFLFKEPKKTIQEINLDGVFGYGEYAQAANYTYTPVTGIYPAVIRYANDAEFKEVDDFTSNIPFGHATIKVKEDAREFIKNDKIYLEREPLERACKEKQLIAFRHKGFWQCMDSKRDKDLLDKVLKRNKIKF